MWLSMQFLGVTWLLDWKPSGLPGFNAPFHIVDIREAHVLEGLRRDGSQGPDHTVGDDRAGAIVQPWVAPVFRNLVVRREEQVAVADVDRARDTAGARIGAITDINDERVWIFLHPPLHIL